MPSDHRRPWLGTSGADRVATDAGSGNRERAPAGDAERWYRVVDIGGRVRRDVAPEI
jgi:hypothetical protein